MATRPVTKLKPRPDADEAPDTKSLCTALNARLKRDAFKLGSEPLPSDVTGFFSTGSHVLDCHLGVQPGISGGIPMGRITELFGPPSHGKSTLLFRILAAAQRGEGKYIDWVADPATGVYSPKVTRPTLPKGIACLIDTEMSFEKRRGQLIGVDIPNLIYIEAKTLDEAFENIDALIEDLSGDQYIETPVVIGWDSLSTVGTAAEAKGKGGIGSKPRIIKEESANLLGLLARRRRISFVFVNQIVSKIGDPHGGYDTAGGWGIKHNASVRLSVQRATSWTRMVGDVQQPLGFNSRVRPIKTKVVAPNFASMIAIRFEDGVNDAQSAWVFLTDPANWLPGKPPITSAKGGWYIIPEKDGQERKIRASEWEELYRNTEFGQHVRSMIRGRIFGAAAALETPEAPETAETEGGDPPG